ncbi:MAG: hypothetical protein ACE5EX_06295, partial [Phycisphaerae bacterium]
MKWTGEVKPTTRMGKTGGVDIGCRRRAPRVVASPRCAEVIRQFGLPPHADVTTILQPSRLPLAPGHVVLIVGPSGSGKTTALQRVYQTCPGALAEWRVGFPTGRAIIDHVAPWAALSRSLSILTACGLGEARLWVRSYETLSDGERFRARLARGVALQCRGRAAGLLLCDEFCGTLHERLARAVSFNLGKLARRCGLSLVVASGRDDIAHDLRPDTILRLHGEG